MNAQERKRLIDGARRVVVKIGTSVITTARNRLDTSHLEELVDQVAGLRRRGREVALVTSGAIAAGMKILAMDRRPADIASLQAAAAVGQSNLMRTYERLFREQGFSVGQVLLTRDVVLDPERCANARNTLEALFGFGIIPVINENDAVAVEEIRFGDNDTLSALVANLSGARLLVMLSDVEGLYLGGRLCPLVEEITPAVLAEAGGAGSPRGVGGMATKLEAARIFCTDAHRLMVIAHGRAEQVLARVLAGDDVGTAFRLGPAGAPGRLTCPADKD